MENWPWSIYWEEIDCELWQWSNVGSWLKEQLICYYCSIDIDPFFILILCSFIVPHNVIIIFFLTIITWWFYIILWCSHPKSYSRFSIIIRMLVVENIIILIIINIITINGSIKHITALWELRLELKDHFSNLHRQYLKRWKPNCLFFKYFYWFPRRGSKR